MTWDIDNFEATKWGVRDVRDSRKNGDWSINTFKYIVEKDLKSWWAYNAFAVCSLSLLLGLRWPVSPYAEKMITQDHKDWDKLTRDCFIYHHACAVHLHPNDYREIIGSMVVPWNIYRPEFHAWRKALLGKKNNYLFWHRVTRATRLTPWYVTELDRYMIDTYNKIQT